MRWGLPEVEEEALPVRKAFEMWGWDRGRPDLNPHTAGWPSLSFYVNLALQHLQYWAGRLGGRYEDRLDFFLAHLDLGTLVTPARILSVLAAVGVVVVGVRLGLRLAGRFGGLVTGLALACSPLLLEQSVKVTPDILLTLFSALALAKCLDVYERGRRRDYVLCAMWIALGAASKYTPILLIPSLLVAHFARPREEGLRRRMLDGRLALAGAVCALVFLAASPYTVFDLAVARRDLPAQFEHVVTAGHFGHELSAPGPVFYLADALPAALGWPGLVLGLAGLALAAWRRRGAWALVALAFGCWYAGLSALRAAQPYYILPAVLPVALGVAGLAEWWRAAGARRPRLSAGLATGLLAVVLIPEGVSSARLFWRYSRPSTNTEAKRCIMEELNGSDVYFACEIGGPTLPRSLAADLSGRPVFDRLDQKQRERALSRPFVNRYMINLYITGPHGSDLYYDLRHYLDYDYIMVVGTARHRYESLAQEYPRQVGFYEDLDRYCDLVRRFRESENRLGPDIWIYRVVPGTRRILDDRGSLTDAFAAGHLDKVRGDDLFSFLTFTGELAARREDWESAARYLGVLFELRPDLRPALLQSVTYVKYRAGRLLEAAELCAELIRQRPDDAEARALGAAILRETVGERGGPGAGH